MLSWAQLHSKSLYLLSSVWVVNGRDDKLWREELRRLQNGPDVCFPGVSVLASQRCAVSRELGFRISALEPILKEPRLVLHNQTHSAWVRCQFSGKIIQGTRSLWYCFLG